MYKTTYIIVSASTDSIILESECYFYVLDSLFACKETAFMYETNEHHGYKKLKATNF